MEPKPVKLFVKMMNSEDPTIEIHADSNDSIKSIHEKILVAARIPVTEQKLFHNGKQLDQCLHTLEDCSIENEASLELKVELRWNDSDESSALLQKIHKMSSNFCRMCQGESVSEDQDVSDHDYKTYLEAFMLSKEEDLEILSLYSVPATMIMLYNSPTEGNKYYADFLIRFSMDLILMSADDFLGDEKASLVLEFCNLLREVSAEDPVYQSCRTTLRKLLEIGNYEIHFNYGLRTMLEIVEFFNESFVALLNGLSQTFYPGAHVQLLKIQFRDFQTFSRVLCKAIVDLAEADEDDDVDIEDDETDEDDEDDEHKVDNYENDETDEDDDDVDNEDDEHKVDNEDYKHTKIFIVLVSTAAIKVGFKDLLKKMEDHISRLPVVLQVLKYTDALKFNDAMRSISFLYLAILNELNSMSQLEEVTKDVVRQMIPDEKLHDEELYNPLIRWSKNLDVKLYKKFKKKDLTDPQVLQDWLCKLCQILLKPQNLLFLACPNDPTKLYPNPELEPHPLHWDCFENCGKAIALALVHEVHVGVALHRVFLLQLAGKYISVEDVRDADPSFYNNKANKEPFPDDDQIQNEFIKSISEQIRFFKNGFDSVFGKSIFQQLSDNGIEPDDLNLVLKGSIELEFNSDENLDDKQNDPLMPQDDESDPLTYRYFVNLQNLNIPEWKKGKRLGEGKFGKVFEGYAPGGFFFAIKEIKIEPEANIEQIYDEIRLLCQLRHPNIVKYYSMEKRERNLYIFLELVTTGSLQRVHENFKLEDSQVSHYTKQILQGLKYLHERNVAHRDIKCANILVNEKGRIKIADFGLAKVMELNTLMKSSYCGTRGWMAPEVAKSGNQYGFKADIWSLGCTVLEMLTRKPPHVMESGKLLDLPDLPSEHSRDFIMKCLKVNPDDRPSAAELLQHPFVKGFGL
uniref:mitogen-activated protein kinase kinase kinase n=1 Tax=Manihot esculenta TaxID=3983 RepID=A0A2C9V5E8_MANES